MKHVIQFVVTKGEGHFVASCTDLPIVTQAASLDELAKNIQEALDLHLEDENLEELGIAPNPSVMMSFELPNKVYA